jgi:ssDNA-binding Zn-finger/Zn-ribbon topoisomerase 1
MRHGFDNADGSCLECSDGHAVTRNGRYGKFHGCSNFPNCHNTEPIRSSSGLSSLLLSEDDIALAYYEAFYDGDG